MLAKDWPEPQNCRAIIPVFYSTQFLKLRAIARALSEAHHQTTDYKSDRYTTICLVLPLKTTANTGQLDPLTPVS